jgi:ubiquinone/menaquinone biosynthesis C-methylase UbiE
MFDLVVNSDTLEHVPDFDRALAEIRRVLKPGGLHIFTVPVIWDRDSRVRASTNHDKLVHHLPPSHRGAPGPGAADLLVFHEFGQDIDARIEAAGFEYSVVRDVRNPARPPSLLSEPNRACRAHY